MWDIYVKLGLG